MRRPNNFLKLSLLTGAVIAPLVLFAPLFLSAQQPAAPTQPAAPAADSAVQDTDTIFSSETRLVPLNITVTDKAGRLLTDLSESAFQIYENGVLQPIKLFKREDVPISLGLIIDNSGSMREKRSAVEAAALALVRDSNPQDEVFVVNFNDKPYLDTDYTSDISKMEQGLTKIDSRGGTAMRDAIQVSIEHLHQRAKRDKKVILVVTDGNDNASLVTLEAVVRQAQQDDVLVYAIGLLTEEEKREASKAKRALNTLVETTGGSVYYPKDVSEVDKIAHEVAHNIRNQYTVAYTPSNSALDGTYRQIKVVVKAPGNPIVHSRSGYYATKDQKPPARSGNPS